MSHDAGLLIYTLIAIGGLIVLIGRWKVHAFVALILAAVFVGLCAGMEPAKIARSFQTGVGSMLGAIAVVVGLGVILGKMLAESGGAEIIARTLIRALGEERVNWTMLIVAFVVGIPVFFTVGLVLLMPIVLTIARETRTPLLRLGVPLLAGLSVVHGLVPPHPGPMAAIGTLNELAGKTDVGRVILYSLLIGLPTAIIAGPMFGKLITDRVGVDPGSLCGQLTATETPRNPPGFGLTLFTILVPVLLMLLSTLADITLPKENGFRQWSDFAGNPNIAMLAAVLFSFYSFGWARGFDRGRILKTTNDCLAPVATILLVVGAGGGFSKVLDAAGVGDAVAAVAKSSGLSPLLLGWLTAALIRIGTGSATVAITMSAGIIAPIAAAAPGLNRELLVIAMGAGSLILSHVNDGGFWFVKEYFGLSVNQTLKTWTVMETIISIVALMFALILNALI
ncbi:MAG: GntT/GntP/DsdX family permease [Limisphaerales bacterium]